MNKIATKNYEEWKSHKLKDPALIKELDDIKDDEAKIEDRFYKDLEFGTAGLRGILGVGTNRMNIYTVAKATYGFAQYILDQSKQMDTIASVAIAYDSRINSDIFAKIAATVMASMGVVVYIWQELMPTPALSYAVRYYHTTGGIVITASHNPSQYNGYKVYGPDGCQITTQGASSISSLIDKIDIFDMDDTYTYEQGIKDDKIIMISDKCFDAFISDISDQSLYKDSKNKDIKIIYTPLYGTGLRCITTCFRHNGFTNIELVEEQAVPDGHFPTCPYPNPEIKEALELGLKAARNKDADILIATDPDCDRVGIAVKDSDDYRLITGNEVGLLLLDYICKRRIELGQMPKSPVCIKSIVTTDLAIKIADDYGVQIIDVLTGFKYIGEQIAYLESKGEEDRFILGFEESYGYLTGT